LGKSDRERGVRAPPRNDPIPTPKEEKRYKEFGKGEQNSAIKDGRNWEKGCGLNRMQKEHG